jgi:hypothetical protein
MESPFFVRFILENDRMWTTQGVDFFQQAELAFPDAEKVVMDARPLAYMDIPLTYEQAVESGKFVSDTICRVKLPNKIFDKYTYTVPTVSDNGLIVRPDYIMDLGILDFWKGSGYKTNYIPTKNWLEKLLS